MTATPPDELCEMAAGASQQKKSREEKEHGWNPKIVEISSRPAQPEMEKDVIEWRVLVPAGAGKKLGERRSQRIRSDAQDDGLVINERHGVVGGNQTDPQQEQGDHLLGDFVWFASGGPA